MSQRAGRLFVASLSILALALVAALPLWVSAGYTRSEDQNGDGRPDHWRVYDRQHRLSDVTIDTNFDGRSDVHEHYERGALVRRESDRDFNDRVDLVQEFDAATREQTRSVVDVDFDGTADLLVLFQGGRPVFSKWATSTSTPLAAASSRRVASSRTPGGQLAPVDDPFSAELTVKAVGVQADVNDCVGLSTSGGLPAARMAVASPLAFSSDAAGSNFSASQSVSILQYSPRGPPAPHVPI